jgi:small subunit ribosomal protein S16
MVKIRLTRLGAKKRPFYRIVAVDERAKRDGRPIEYLGTYDPKPEAEEIRLREEALQAWLSKGARMTDTVASLVKRARARAASETPAEA